MPTAAVARSGHNPWWVGFVSGLASYIDACAIVSSGIAFVIYRHTIGLTDGQYGALSGALTFSIAVGALFGGRLGDRFDRKHVFSATMVFIVVGAIAQVLAGGFLPLLIGTILVGLGTGADLPVSLATIAESADDDNRGKIIVFSNILWVVGILGAIIVSSIVGNWGRIGGQFLTGIAVDIVGLDVAFWSRVSLIMMPLGFVWAFWSMKVIDTPSACPTSTSAPASSSSRSGCTPSSASTCGRSSPRSSSTAWAAPSPSRGS